MTPEEVLEFMKDVNARLKAIDKNLDLMIEDIDDLNTKLGIIKANKQENSTPISLA